VSRRLWARLAGALALAAVLVTGLTTSVAVTGVRTARPTVADVPADLLVGQVLVVRPKRIDVVRDGTLLRSIAVANPVDLAALPVLVDDPAFVSSPAVGVVRLSALLAQRPGTVVTASAPTVSRVEFAAGSTGIRGTNAVLSMSGITMQAVGGDFTAAPPSVDRAAVEFTNAATVDLTDVGLEDMGGTGAGTPALRVGEGSTAKLTRVTLQRSGDAVQLSAVDSAVLRDVRVTRSVGIGLVVRGGRSVSLSSVNVVGGGADGIRIDGPIETLDVSGGLVANRNGGDGVKLVDVRDATVSLVSTAGNGGTGLDMRDVAGLTVTNVTARNDETAVAVRNSSDVRLLSVAAIGAAVSIKDSNRVAMPKLSVTDSGREALYISGRSVTVTGASLVGGAGGIEIGPQSSDVTVRDTTVEATGDAVRVSAQARSIVLDHVTASAASGTAVSTSGSDVIVRDSTLSGAVGVRVRGSADAVVIEGTSVRATGAALDAARGTVSVTVTSSELTSGGPRAVISGAASLTLEGTTVDGSDLGLDVLGQATLSDVGITAEYQAVRAGQGSEISITGSRLAAAEIGVSGRDGARVTIADSLVSARLARTGDVTLIGDNDISPLPLRWLGLAVAAAIALAIGLELLRKFRDTDPRPSPPPAHVGNRA